MQLLPEDKCRLGRAEHIENSRLVCDRNVPWRWTTAGMTSDEYWHNERFSWRVFILKEPVCPRTSTDGKVKKVVRGRRVEKGTTQTRARREAMENRHHRRATCKTQFRSV